jgi:hypothetical protein
MLLLPIYVYHVPCFVMKRNIYFSWPNCGKLMVLLTEKLQGNLYQKLRLSVFFLFSFFFGVVGVGFKMCLQATLTSYLFCRVKKKNALDRCITCGQLSFLVVLSYMVAGAFSIVKSSVLSQ